MNLYEFDADTTVTDKVTKERKIVHDLHYAFGNVESEAQPKIETYAQNVIATSRKWIVNRDWDLKQD